MSASARAVRADTIASVAAPFPSTPSAPLRARCCVSLRAQKMFRDGVHLKVEEVPPAAVHAASVAYSKEMQSFPAGSTLPG